MKLVAGPNVLICDECVTVWVDIIANDSQLRASAPDPERLQRLEALANKLPHQIVACSLCGNPSSLGAMLPVARRGVVCGECADAVEDALASGKPAR